MEYSKSFSPVLRILMKIVLVLLIGLLVQILLFHRIDSGSLILN